MHTTFVVHSVVSRDARVRLSRSSARIRLARAPVRMTSTDLMSTPTRARRVVRARASDDEAQDSSAYRAGAEKPELDGVLGKLVSNFPTDAASRRRRVTARDQRVRRSRRAIRAR